MTPEVSAGSLVDWIDGFDVRRTGEYWAPRGAGFVSNSAGVMLEGLLTTWTETSVLLSLRSARRRVSYRLRYNFRGE